jgi:L-threonylcarbamoyladenylate synthase
LQKKISAHLAAKSRTTEAWLFFAQPRELTGPNIFWLDARGDARRAARKLFGQLRTLDSHRFKKIHAELAPGRGLAEAINDRLRRAAGLGQT